MMMVSLLVASLLVVWGSTTLLLRAQPGSAGGGVITGNGMSRPVAALMAIPPLAVGLILVGFRPLNSGGDTEQYVNTYRHLTGIGSAYQVGRQLFGNTELLFWRVQALMKPFLDGAESWLVVNFIIVAILSWIAYRSLLCSSDISTWLFGVAFLTYFLVYAGNGMRQSYEIPIAALSLSLFYRKRYIAALIAAVVATMFHWSAVLLVGAIPVALLPKRRWLYLSVPVVALALHPFLQMVLEGVAPFLGSSLQNRYNLYFVKGASTTIANPWTSINLWTCVVIYVTFVCVCRFSDPLERGLCQYQLLYMTMVMATVNTPEVWTRSMVNLLFIIPVTVAVLLLHQGRWPLFIELSFEVFFVAMFLSIYFSSSARLTLGI